MGTKETPSLLRTLWSSEIIAESLYGFLAARYDDDDERKKSIVTIGKMERWHANVWNKLANDVHAVSFQVSLSIKFRIALAKLLSLLLPLTIFIHYLEHSEKKAILDYAGLLEIYKDDEKAKSIIINVIKQEIGHEWHMMEQIADRKLYIAKIREAIPGMTAGIIETLGLVIGLVAARARTLVIGLTGLIAMLGGMIAEMSISYIASKGHRDLDEGRNKELNIKTEVSPAVLRRELENDLAERRVNNETIRLIMDIVGSDAVVLSSLVKTITTGAHVPHPKESLKTTATFFAIGALPVLAPFFVGSVWGSNPLIPAIVAFALAIVSISIAGLIMAVLSGRSISTNIAHNLFVIMGTCALTYMVGLAARFLLGLGR
ncbi:MAG: VIT1/CCC1 transporter family protein [Syntrophorhabdales bacterium]|jgi:VIT1/CCC1 family predicted Fe2+/Mn2+ transporter